MALQARTIRARRLRRDSTDVERIFWRALRERLPAWKFRRQHPIGGRIADFACPEGKLVIELDGGQHALEAAEDAVRTAEMGVFGYRVIRFWNLEVVENVEGVLEVVKAELERCPPALPGPLRPEGQRGGML